MALPREATQASYFKSLAKRLGEYTPIELQALSQSVPKPVMAGRGLGRALALLTTLAAMAPAEAGAFYVPLANGGYLVIPDGFIVLAVLTTLAIGGGYAISQMWSSIFRETPQPSPEDYDQHATRLRAMARMHDAQAAHDDSHAKAVLKQQELQEVQAFLQEQRRKRGQR